MGKADALSRMTGFETGINDNKDLVLLKPEHFIRNLRSHYPEEDLVFHQTKSYMEKSSEHIMMHYWQDILVNIRHGNLLQEPIGGLVLVRM